MLIVSGAVEFTARHGCAGFMIDGAVGFERKSEKLSF